MAHGQVTVWKCDRCGKRQEVNNGDIPNGWSTVEVAQIEDDGQGLRPKWEVCDGCASQVKRFMINKDDVPAAGTEVQLAN